MIEIAAQPEMLTEPPIQVAPASTQAGGDGIAVYQTSPARLTMHRIEDHELESLINISSPITLTLAGAFGGGFLGLLSSAITAYDHVTTKTVTSGDLTSVLVCGACGVGVIVAGAYAIQGQKRAAAKLKDIRSRIASPLPNDRSGG